MKSCDKNSIKDDCEEEGMFRYHSVHIFDD